MSREVNQRIDAQSREFNQRYDKHSDEITQVRVDVSATKALVNNFLGKVVDGAFKASSPLRLTKLGEEMALSMGADDILAKHGQRLEEIVLVAEPPTAYHLQNECLHVVERHLEPLLSKQELAAAAGEALKRDLPLSHVLGIVGILLRDKLIEEHPQWSLGDTGESTP